MYCKLILCWPCKNTPAQQVQSNACSSDAVHRQININGYDIIYLLIEAWCQRSWWTLVIHYSDVIIGTMTSQITSLTTVYSTISSDADQRRHQSSASLAFVRGIHRGPVNSPHKWPVTRKMFPLYDVIMYYQLDPQLKTQWHHINKSGETFYSRNMPFTVLSAKWWTVKPNNPQDPDWYMEVPLISQTMLVKGAPALKRNIFPLYTSLFLSDVSIPLTSFMAWFMATRYKGHSGNYRI